VRKLLIYGDSNSFGTAPMSSLGAQSVHPRGARWGDILAGRLSGEWEVVIEGLGGRTTVHDDPIEGAYRNGLTILPAILHSHKPIDLLAICLGTNDQKLRFGLGAQDVALGLARLTREALATETVGKVLLIAPPPVKECGDFALMFSGASTRCKGLAAAILRVAEEEGATFFDAGTVIETDEADGIHWSAASHATLGEALEPVIRSLG
jgi:lysophospholipase L1-like esterase